MDLALKLIHHKFRPHLQQVDCLQLYLMVERFLAAIKILYHLLQLLQVVFFIMVN